jgi:hypothetical protein
MLVLGMWVDRGPAERDRVPTRHSRTSGGKEQVGAAEMPFHDGE